MGRGQDVNARESMSPSASLYFTFSVLLYSTSFLLFYFCYPSTPMFYTPVPFSHICKFCWE